MIQIVSNDYIILNTENDKLNSYILEVPHTAKIRKFYIIVTSEDKVKPTLYRLKDLSKTENENGIETYKIKFPDLKKGTRIQEYTELSHKTVGMIENYEFDLAISFPIEELKYVFSYPSECECLLDSKKIGPNKHVDIEVYKDNENKKTTLIYQAKNVQAFKIEKYSPSIHEMGLVWSLQFSQLLHNTFYANNWFEYFTENSSFHFSNEPWYSTEIEEITESLTANISDEEDKIRTIFNYIQDEIKIDIQSKNKILKEKKGNPYQVTGHMLAILKEANIDVKYLHVHSVKKGYFDKDYISLEQIPYPMLKVNSHDHEYFLIPYMKSIPFSFIPDYLLGETAVEIDAENESIKYIQLPKYNSIDNKVNFVTKVKIEEDLDLHIEDKIFFSGMPTVFLREKLSKIDSTEYDNFFEDYFSYENTGDVSFNVSGLENAEDSLIVTASHQISDLVIKTPDEIIVQIAGYLSPTVLSRFMVEEKKRIAPVLIRSNNIFERYIIFHKESDWQLVIKENRDLSAGNQYGHQFFRIEEKNDRVIISQVKVLKKGNGNKETYPDLIDILGTKSGFVIPDLVFKISK